MAKSRSKKQIVSSFLLNAFSWLTVIGTICTMGFLSYTGAMAVNLSWFNVSPVIWGIVFFIFAMVFDILVAKQSVEQAFKKLPNFGEDYLKEAVTKAALDAAIKEEQKNGKSLPQALQKYATAKKVAEEMEHREERIRPITWIFQPKKSWALHKEQQACNAALQEAIADIQKRLSSNEPLDPVEKKIKTTIAYEVGRRSSRPLTLCILLTSLLAGVSATFSALYAIQTGLIDLGILAGTSVSWAICWPLSIFAGIGFSLYLYDELKMLMDEGAASEAFDTLCNKTKGSAYYINRFILVVLAGFVVAGIFWTWFTTSVEVGSQILPWGSLAVSAFMGTFAAIIIIPTLLWNVSKSFTALKIVEAWWEGFTFSAAWNALTQRIREDWRQHAKKGAYHQFFNPLRLVEKLLDSSFYLIALLGHSVSIGFTATRLGGLSPAVVAITSATIETATNIAFVPGAEHGEEKDTEQHHPEKIIPVGSRPDNRNAFFSCFFKQREDMIIYMPSDSSEETALSSDYYPIGPLPEPEHTHVDIAGIILMPILFPLKIARFIIDSVIGTLFAPFLKNGWWDSVCDSSQNIFSNPVFETLPIPCIPSPENRVHGNEVVTPGLLLDPITLQAGRRC
jgi:hypothetical protein